MKRSKHSLSHYRLLTGDMGELLPIACFEVLPGDSIQQASSALIRVSPLLAPVMHPVQVRIHHWYIPHRIVWPQFEDFITGGPDGAGTGVVYPEITMAVEKGHLADYLGLPIGVTVNCSKLPFWSYNAVFNEFYRDQDLQSEISADTFSVQKVAWGKDYFTTARPWPQKGPDITLPLGVAAPVRGIGMESQTYTTGPQTVYEPGGVGQSYGKFQWMNVTVGARQAIREDPANPGFPEIYADLTNATATNINDVRKAFALQRYQEARAQYGSRYTEYLRYLGVRSSDARLQRPEYLGGGKATISFSEVLQTGPGSDTDESVVGTLKGHGIAALRSRRYRRFFEEHGIVLSLLSVVPKSIYMQGVERMWSRRTKEDYWQRELELIGQQEIKKKELYVQSADPNGTFGWQDRYAEYRHVWSSVSGDFHDTLNFWHMGRDFAAEPVLNASFIECQPTKRVNAVQTEDVLWIMANNSVQARRMVTKKTIGRII